MRIAPLVVLALLLAGAAPPPVATVPVEVLLSAEGGVAKAVVSASAVLGEGTAPSRIETAESNAGKATLFLQAGIAWRVSARGKDLWAPETTVVPAGAGGQVALRLRRTGAIQGSFVVPRGERLPASLAVRFESTAASHDADAIVRSSFECAAQNGDWRCAVPHGHLDLRIQVKGYIPKYLWDVDVEPGRTVRLGPLHLLHGSSVAGRVQISNGQPTDRSCAVDLSPGPAGTASIDARRHGELTLVAKVDAKGFFQFEDVQPGSFSLAAHQEGLARTVLAPVIVERNQETEIAKPLVLTPPLKFEVSIDPPLDARGSPWRALLRVKDLRLGNLRDVAAGRLTDGRFSRQGLDPGHYHLDIVDGEGASFLAESFDLEADLALARQIALVDVEGSVTKGGQPLATKLEFIGSGSRSTAIELVSDAKGRFSGVLSHEGTWRVELAELHRTLRNVVVHRPAGARVAKVALDIPDNRVSGDVVDEGLNPVADASVTATDLKLGDLQTARTDDRGAFEISGLAEARHLIGAEADLAGHHLTSDEVTLTLGKDHARETIRLVLHEQVAVDGTVSSPAGPVIGCQLIAIPKAPTSTFLSAASTDATGSFHLDVPAAAHELQILVMPPGFAFRSLHLAAPFPKPLAIAVDDSGGSLVLKTPPVDFGDAAAAKPLIAEDGQPLLLSFLLPWARTAGQSQQDPSRVALPRMAPGEYVACMVSPDEQIRVILGLAALGGRGCSQGTLAPHGELVLDLTAGEGR